MEAEMADRIHYWKVDGENHGICCKCGAEKDYPLIDFYDLAVWHTGDDKGRRKVGPGRFFKNPQWRKASSSSQILH